MKKTKGYALARSMLDQTGYADWDLAVASMTYCTGVCIHEAKVILLADWLLKSADFNAIADSVAHEIAHAKTKGHGHGAKWQDEYYKLTGDYHHGPTSLLRVVDIIPKPSQIGICEKNHITISYHTTTLVCDVCNREAKKVKLKPAWRRQLKSLIQ